MYGILKDTLPEHRLHTYLIMSGAGVLLTAAYLPSSSFRVQDPQRLRRRQYELIVAGGILIGAGLIVFSRVKDVELQLQIAAGKLAADAAEAAKSAASKTAPEPQVYSFNGKDCLVYPQGKLVCFENENHAVACGTKGKHGIYDLSPVGNGWERGVQAQQRSNGNWVFWHKNGDPRGTWQKV